MAPSPRPIDAHAEVRLGWRAGMSPGNWLVSMFLIGCLVTTTIAQQRSPFFATVVGPDGTAIAGAEVSCVFTPNLFAVGEPDIVTAVTDARGRARCDLIVGRLYMAWAIGPADVDGVRSVSESVPLAAAGRVMELSAFERVAPRRVQVAGLGAWRDVGAAGLRWFPDGSQELHVDLPMPEGGDVMLPASPYATGCLAARDAEGELMVVTRVEPEPERPLEFAAPMLVHAEVTDAHGEPLCDVLIEQGVGLNLTWGVFHSSQQVDRHRVAGRTDADGRASFHVPKVATGPGRTLQASRRGLGWQHRRVTAAGPETVCFQLEPTEPTALHVSGIDAAVDISITAGFTISVGSGVMLGDRRVEADAHGPNRWLVHAHGSGFIPRMLVAQKVPAAVIWDWVDQQMPTEIDVAKLHAVEVQVVDRDGGPSAAALAIMRGGNGVPLRWEQLFATDLAGRAKLWLPQGDFLVYSTTGSEHAYQLVDGNVGDTLQLRLQPLPSMRVRVMDGDRPVPLARASIASVHTGGNEAPGMVATYLSFNYAKSTHSNSRGEIDIRVFALPRMSLQMAVHRGHRKSEPFEFVAGGETEVQIRD